VWLLWVGGREVYVAEKYMAELTGVQGMQVLKGNIDKTGALGVEKELVMVVCNMQDILVRMLGSL
jgi:hypothetical protein